MLCWFKPNVCNKTLSYFWMRVCWRLQHDDIVLCAISSVWGRSASSCVLPFLTDEWLNPSQSISSFFFFGFVPVPALSPSCQDTHTRLGSVRKSSVLFYFSVITSQSAPKCVGKFFRFFFWWPKRHHEDKCKERLINWQVTTEQYHTTLN